MSDGLLALTTMTASGEPCGCDTLAVEPTNPPDQNIGSTPPGASAFWSGVIGVEGELTGDGRFIEPDALTWDLPMPLRYVSSDVGEHGGAQVAGRILQTERRPGGLIWAAGDYDMSSEVGREAERQVREMLTNGVSMDLDDVSFEVRVAADLLDGTGQEPMGPPGADGRVTVVKINASDEVRATMSARVRAATIVQIPAFKDAQIFSADTMPEVGVAAPMPGAGLMPDGVTACSTDENSPDYDPACVAASDAAAPVEDAPVLASAAPLAPPSEWFSSPRFKAPTPLTITDDGRIYGHLAAWGTCHIGLSHNGCVTAPKSRSGYAYFRTGSLRTAENNEVPVGHITLDTTHAQTSGLSAAGAQNHYERTGHVVADVAAGEDSHGIWVSGALRPGVTAAQLRELRAAPLSGDWRRVGGNLELVAALAVNVPGFPIPRPHGLVAGGVVQSLVASGMIPPRMVLTPGTEGALSMDDLSRLKQLAEWHRQDEAKRATDAAMLASAIPTAADLVRRVRASSLAMRVHSMKG